jgi:hypothetical protein
MNVSFAVNCTEVRGMIPDEIMKDFYRKLLARLESIDITLDEINTTLKRFGNPMSEPIIGVSRE